MVGASSMEGSSMESRFWNPRTETGGREALEALQLRKLRDLVGWTHESAPLQAAKLREAGVGPAWHGTAGLAGQGRARRGAAGAGSVGLGEAGRVWRRAPGE